MPLVAAIVVLRIAGEPDEGKHVAHAVESRTEADQHEKRRSDDGLERVPHGDEAGFGNRRPAGYVGHEGREGDGRPEPPPVENERCQSDAGRRPDRCDEPVGDLELDPDPRRNHIRDEESQKSSACGPAGRSGGRCRPLVGGPHGHV